MINYNLYKFISYKTFFFIKFKILMLLSNILIYICNIKNVYIKLKEKNQYLYNEQNIYNTIYMNFKPKPNNPNDPIFIKEKKKIFEMISKAMGRKISSVNTIIFSEKCKFGNCIIYINKLIFYCEILGCNKIILNKDINWFLKNKIYYQKYNMTIEVDNINKYNKSNSLLLTGSSLYYSIFNIKLEDRIDIIKNEILLNLPKTITNPNDIYIHIRSGDIFINDTVTTYAQPPLCFYQSILKGFIFRNIYIISFNKNNPVINKLIKENDKIIFKQNPIKLDISLLVNAYNLVGSISSFLINIIKLNINIKIFFEYNNYKIIDKIYHLHFDLYKITIKCIIFRMEPTQLYNSRMYIWKNNKKQIKLMIKEKCNNTFKIIK